MSTYADLKSEYRATHDSGGAWGSAMEAFFALAAELYYRGADLPSEWHYRPNRGAIGGDPRESEDYLYPVFELANTADLERLGATLYRYTRALDSAGRSY